MLYGAIIHPDFKWANSTIIATEIWVENTVVFAEYIFELDPDILWEQASGSNRTV